MSPTNGGYIGQASQQRSIQHGDRGSTRDGYGNHEANISNHEVGNEQMDDELYQEDMFGSNRPKGDRMSLTRGGNTSSRARQHKSRRGDGTRSIRSNNEHHDPSTLNDKLRGEHADDLPRASNRTRGPNRGIPMPADRSQHIEITIKNST
ncbi:uncharacterized protein LOC111377706 [Olea europaea var. sylvestris]|uniref:uncharacterized protein LOC111377706 n=1 Tax=Olea europaea var. sylvestris TaxID=158386 RepID=UPI000C1D477B|nr:uncharacterized protein LOC111377706 [Olea europaea var. sylvestris]